MNLKIFLILFFLSLVVFAQEEKDIPNLGKPPTLHTWTPVNREPIVSEGYAQLFGGELRTKETDPCIGTKRSPQRWMIYTPLEVSLGGELIYLDVTRDMERTAIYVSDFSSGVDGWSVAGGTITPNRDGIGGEDDCLMFVSNGATSVHSIYQNNLINPNLFSNNTILGNLFSFTADVYIKGTNVVMKSLLGGFTNSNIGLDITYTASDSWETVSFWKKEFSSARGLAFAGYSSGFTFAGNATDTFYIKNIELTIVPGYNRHTTSTHKLDTSTVYKYGGDYSLFVGRTGGTTADFTGSNDFELITLTGFNSPTIYQFPGLTEGTTYRFSMYAYNPSHTSNIKINYGYNTNGTHNGTTEQFAVSADSFEVINFDFTVASGDINALSIALQTPDTIYIDNVSLKEIFYNAVADSSQGKSKILNNLSEDIPVAYYHSIFTYTKGAEGCPPDTLYEKAPTDTFYTPVNAPLWANGFSVDLDVHLQWTNQSLLNPKFQISRKKSWESNYTIIDTTLNGVISYEDNGLLKDTSYQYRIVALGTYRNSSPLYTPAIQVVSPEYFITFGNSTFVMDSTDVIPYNDLAQAYFDTLATKSVTLSDSAKTFYSSWCDCLDDSLNAGARNKTFNQLGFVRWWWIIAEDSIASRTDMVAGQMITNIGADWTKWGGYTTNGTSDVLNTNWIPSTMGASIFVQNSASFGYGTPTNRLGDTGAYNGTWRTMFNPRYGSSGHRVSINQAGIWNIGTNVTSNGHFIVRRTGSTTAVTRKNHETEYTDTGGSAAPYGFAVWLGAFNDDGSPFAYDALTFYYYYTGKGFSTEEDRKIKNCTEQALETIGKGLIP